MISGNDKPLGTPKTLNESIRHGLMIGPLVSIDANIEGHVRDFLSQKFQTALLKAGGTPTEAALMALWKEIKGQ